MNNRIIRTKDGRVYRCVNCPYRNRLTGFCGFCMKKILDELKDKTRIPNPPKKNEPER
jgi:hypothetical protein